MEAAPGSRTYTQCNPRCEWIKVGKLDALRVDVSGLGFKKEDLRVAADTGRRLNISGECFLQGDQWRRFHRRFELPKNCNVAEIQANFDKGVLYVLLPDSATGSEKEGGRVLGKKSTLLIVMIIAAIALAIGLGICTTN